MTLRREDAWIFAAFVILGAMLGVLYAAVLG